VLSIFGDYQSLAAVLEWMVETVPQISLKKAYQVMCGCCAPGRVQIVGVATRNHPGVLECALLNDQPLSWPTRASEIKEIPISQLCCLFPRGDGQLCHVKTRLPWWQNVKVEVSWLKNVWVGSIDDLNLALSVPAVETPPSAAANVTVVKDFAPALPTQTPSKPGPKPKIRQAIKNGILGDLASGKHSIEDLKAWSLDALAANYGGSRNTAGKARAQALEEYRSEFKSQNSERC
jgi:hypothetical protein